MKVKAISHEVYSGDETFCLLVHDIQMRLESEQKKKNRFEFQLSHYPKKVKLKGATRFVSRKN